MAQAMTQFTLTPLPDRNNLFKALEMLVSNDPIAGVFAKGVLQAFGAPALAEAKEQIRQLLQIWDNVISQQGGALSHNEQHILDQARMMVDDKNDRQMM